MANNVMRFVLEGRDRLSPVLDHAGDSAARMHRRIDDSARRSGDSVERMGRRVEQSSRRMEQGAQQGSDAMDKLRSALWAIAPAAAPVAVALAPIAVHAGAAGVAVAALGAALGHQITSLTDAATAEQAYKDAVNKSGAASEAAIQAQLAYQKQVQALPPATRQAVAAMSALKDTYQKWSDSVSSQGMLAVTKGMMGLGALLPKLTGMAKGAAGQMDRLVTVAAGAFATPGFDALVGKLTTFANSSLKRAVDGVVHLMRVVSQGSSGFSSGFTQFMGDAKALGPQVADTLKNLARALGNVLAAATHVGGGILSVVNAFAKLLAAMPTGLLTALLQVATTFKLITLASAGLKAVRSGLVSMTAGALTAAERMGRLRTAIVGMSVAARTALATSGIGLLVLAIGALASQSKKSVDVDRMTTALGRLAQTGKASGEATRVFGRDLGSLYDSVRSLTDPSGLDKAQQAIVHFLSLGNWDSTPVEKAKGALDGVDKALASLVRGGHADQAAIALDILSAKYAKGGHDAGQLKTKLDDYKSALADQRFEQDLTAQSMGLFGQQAQQVQAKLNAQKLSADGLRQSIQALNDVNRQGLGGMIGFEAAIDAAAKAAKDNAGSLRMVHGQLNLNSEKARSAASALQDLASKTDEAAAAAVQAHRPWSEVNAIYGRGRAQLAKTAQQMGLTREQARKLANQILNTPDKTAKLKGDIADLKSKIADAKQRLKNAPSSKTAKIRGDIANLQAKLQQAKAALASLRDKTVRITSVYYTAKDPKTLGQAHGRAHGGLVPRYAGGGNVQVFPGGGLVQGPGTGTSDSILGLFSTGPARVSNREYVIRAAAVRKYGVRLFDLLNSMRLGTGGGGGGMAGAGMDTGRGLIAGMHRMGPAVIVAARRMAGGALHGVRAELQIASPSRRMKKLGTDAGKGMILGLTGTRAQIKSTAERLAKDIWAAFTGSKDNRLVAQLKKATKELQDLADQRDAIAKKLAAAKQFAADTTATAKASAALPTLSEGVVTAGGVKKFLTDKLHQLKKFTNLVKKLADRGLNKGLLRQILNMGPEAGYAYADALAKADKGTLKSINSLQSEIDKASKSLGKSGADMLYDSGKNAGKGFLKGLEGQKKAIENLMMDIAKGMQKAIRKALGIKSPSRVMARLGRFTAEGLVQGMRERVPWVERASLALAGAAVGPAAAVPTRRMAWPEPRAAAPATTTTHHTYHLYQRDMTVRDLEVLQRRQEALARVGRPR